MTAPARHYFTVSVILVIIIGVIAVDVMWLTPKIQALRKTIDNDRAAAILIDQQQSNLLKLRQDLAGIQEAQVNLEKYVWPFVQEETFFSTFESIAKQNQVGLEVSAISDSTPTGTILPRTATIVIRGPSVAVFTALNDIQKLKPLVAIQKLTISKNISAGQIQATIIVATLWK